jgi:hypothetical protein
MNQLREEIQVREAQKEAEAKKRGTRNHKLASRSYTYLPTRRLEMAEEARAKAAVKAQIEADKKARAEKAAMEKALREGRAPPGANAPVNVPKPAAAAAAGTAGRDFKDTRLQIRMSTGGSPLTTTLSSDACKSTPKNTFSTFYLSLIISSSRSCRIHCQPKFECECRHRRFGSTLPSVCPSVHAEKATT